MKIIEDWTSTTSISWIVILIDSLKFRINRDSLKVLLQLEEAQVFSILLQILLVSSILHPLL